MKIQCAMFLVFSLSILSSSAQSSSGDWTEKKATKWFKKGDWLKGLKLKPHTSVDPVEFAKQYHANQALWDTAFAFLRETNIETIAPGKYLLKGDDVYVSIADGPTKEFEATKWESHRKYIDIQYIYKGKEKIGVYPSSKATVVSMPYDENKDVMNYDIKDGDYYISDPQTFFIFFPQDAHRPSIKVEGADTVKKVVVKVRVAK